MEFIATYWYIWLAVMIMGYGYAFSNQLRRMKRMMTNPRLSFESSNNQFFKGLGLMFIAAAFGAGGTVLLIIAILVNIVKAAG